MTVPFYVSYAALWVLVIFQTLVLLGLVRAVYRARGSAIGDVSLAAHNGSLVGQPAPKFTAFDVSGKAIDETAISGRLSALLFVSTDCSTCAATLDELDALQLKTSGNVIVVCRAGSDECSRLSETYRLTAPIIVDRDSELSELFGVRVTPTAVLVGADGRIQTYGHPLRGEQLAALLAEIEAQAALEEVHVT